MARYSLWLMNKENHSYDEIIKFSFMDANNNQKMVDKVDLIDIDKFTTEYNSKSDLIYSLKHTDKINTDDYELIISYQSNKKEKHLDVAYYNDIPIKNFSHKYYGEKFLPTTDKDLILIRDYILDSSREKINEFSSNGKIYRELMNSSYLNDYIKEKIKLYVYARSGSSKDESDRQFAKTKLLEELSRYKNIRGITFFLKKCSENIKGLRLPDIIDHTNFEPKMFVKNFVDDDLTEIDNEPETYGDYKDLWERNYDEPEPEDEEFQMDTGENNTKGKIFTKTRLQGSSHGQVPGQITFFDN